MSSEGLFYFKGQYIRTAKESEKRRAQILAPVYNRLDIILGDEYLSECMECDNGIDLVENHGTTESNDNKRSKKSARSRSSRSNCKSNF